MQPSTKANTNAKNNSKVEEPAPLPAGFLPGDHDVVIGKGKKFYFHTGNQWLRTLVSTMLDEYKEAQTKSDKSNIISDIVEYVRKNGRFVRRDQKNGTWIFAEPLLCREKCSQGFRDNLADTYRSSNVAKRNKRRQEQQEKRGGVAGTTTGMIMPDAKRMRTVAPIAPPTVMAAPVAVVAPIPTHFFDMEMPSLAAHAQAVQVPSLQAPVAPSAATINNLLHGGLDLTGIDLSALTNLLNGYVDNSAQQQQHTQAVRRASLSLISDFFSAPQADANNININTFEPTPLPNAMGNVLGNHAHQAQVSQPMASLAASLFEPLFQQEQQQQQWGVGAAGVHVHQQAAKRHSLAFTDADWFKLPSDDTTNNNNTTTTTNGTAGPDYSPKVNAAFAA